MSIIVNTNGDNRKIGTQHKASTASTIFAWSTKIYHDF